MKRLIQHLGVALITTILGLCAFDIWSGLYPPALGYPNQVAVVSDEIFWKLNQVVDSPHCYEVMPRFTFVDADGRIYCDGGERVRIQNCP